MIQNLGDLPLRRGGLLRGVELAYVTYGRLDADGRNAILLAHGYTSSHLFAEPAAAPYGGWSELVGPGRAIDTDRYFVVSSNMLGSSYGSTGPRSVDPATGRAYGPDFPALTLSDIVAAERRLLESLGVRELLAVVGPSYGGFQAFTWAVEYPELVGAIAPVTTAPRTDRAIDIDRLTRRLAADPAWNGGRYREGALLEAMAALRVDTLTRYGMSAVLADRHREPEERAAVLRAGALEWARSFDAYSMIRLGEAANDFDVTERLGEIRAPVLLVLSRTDALFPPSIAPGVLSGLRAAAEATYVEIDSEYGHLAPGFEAAQWAPALAELLARAAGQRARRSGASGPR